MIAVSAPPYNVVGAYITITEERTKELSIRKSMIDKSTKAVRSDGHDVMHRTFPLTQCMSIHKKKHAVAVKFAESVLCRGDTGK